MGWADTPLARVADLTLPAATHAERSGTFVNVQNRLQRFERAFPPPSQARPALEILAELLARFDSKWGSVTPATTFDLLAEEVESFDGLRWSTIPADGQLLPGREPGEGAA
jgi:predicted molibdopterin-dependent oxidoreductase YjgC